MRYMAELEELIEDYRAFALNAIFATQTDQIARDKLLKRTHKVIGPPGEQRTSHDQDCQETRQRNHARAQKET
jgi:hypothetical protein